MRGEVASQKTLMQGKNDSIAGLNKLLEVSESEKQVAIDAKDNFTFFGIEARLPYPTALFSVLRG